MTHLPNDTRNVQDKYKGWTEDLIRADIQVQTTPLAVAMFQLAGDFNFSTVIRNSNAFGARQVFYIGNKRFDRRGAVGTHIYTDVTHFPNFSGFKWYMDELGYTLVALEQHERAVELPVFNWPAKSCILLGEESLGLTDEIIDQCEHVVEIPQRGSVRSLNAGVASGIAIYSYSLQHS